MKKAVILARSFARSAKDPLRLLETAGIQVEIKKDPDPENEKIVSELIGDAEGVLVGMDRVGEVVFTNCPNLKVVSKHGVGVDNIDLQSAQKHSVVVANAPGTNSISVAEMAFTLILILARKIPHFFEQVKNKEWGATSFGLELEGKTIGIVGFGRIGKNVAQYAQAFAMKVLYYDPFITDEISPYKKVELEILFKDADFISLHAPLTDETREMVNDKLLSLMKKEAFLINTARGELINEEALYLSLKENRIAGAALDVFTHEPPFDNPLLSLPNVIATPHISSHTREANLKMGNIAAENLIRVFNGEEPLYRVV
ncbi:phosphoglycerate dehydrogenase [Atribacter laminatus]|uniref:Hydroxypyruvate reductase n=1 Tax=Atribacter laminatus TaxID=2847778 RepID=A0A7T1AJK8_ATRLM|nr:phosphoglycerate dehydrogenase [Atribacter laminatus]QPM67116.1 Hydroxypyruvate reductase [Atribacter laminatus]